MMLSALRRRIALARCVVGSSGSASDDTAPRFSYLFYQNVAAGMEYRQAFEMGQSEVAFVSTAAADTYTFLTRQARAASIPVKLCMNCWRATGAKPILSNKING